MRILIAPLDWGIGHAARCIPIIRYLLEKGCKVIIAADGRPMHLLKEEFSTIEFIQMPGYAIVYPAQGSMALKIAVQIPKILSGIKKEHALLKTIIKEKKIDAVISDNRFGLWSKEVPCVFITHQLMVKAPFGEKWIHRLNNKYISKYTQCWVPDTPRPELRSQPLVAPKGGEPVRELAGDLAHKFPLPANAKFIGVLSRFASPPRPNGSSGRATPELRSQLSPTAQFGERGAKQDMLVILSGPEPQRTVLEKKILKQFQNIPRPDKVGAPPSKGELTALIVQGITEKNERRKLSENVEIVSYLGSAELEKEIISSEIVLSRPGYSSVMDLAVLGKKAIFVPTPGQTEQEYLAKYFSEQGIAYSVSQDKFDLQVALKESEKYSGFTEKYSGEEFKRAVDSFILSLK